jgi:hypothetical protein
VTNRAVATGEVRDRSRRARGVDQRDGAPRSA